MIKLTAINKIEMDTEYPSVSKNTIIIPKKYIGSIQFNPFVFNLSHFEENKEIDLRDVPKKRICGCDVRINDLYFSENQDYPNMLILMNNGIFSVLESIEDICKQLNIK